VCSVNETKLFHGMTSRKGHTMNEMQNHGKTTEEPTVTINRQHKSILFGYVLTDKKTLLNLYNALNDTAYTNEDDLTINTLEDAIYLGVKNDLSFLIGSTVNLYEHQSSINKNMPLRGLTYITKIYNAHIAINNENIFGSKLIRLPRPECLVFYNGVQSLEERETLRLSDAFYDSDDNQNPGCLEFTVTVLNINYGSNKELLKKCKELEEYAIFNHRIREYLKQGMVYEKAIRIAVDECIAENILHDILTKNKAEVIDTMLFEYDQEKHYEALREESREEGREEGRKEGEARAEERFKSVLIEHENMINELKSEIAKQNEIIASYKVENAILFEYDQEKHYEALREEGEERAKERFKNKIAEKNIESNALKNELIEKDSLIADKKALIAEKDVVIADKEAQLTKLLANKK